MTRAVRICKAKHKKQAFTGIGAQFASGRWHQKMTSIVYCSDTSALAALEVFVHLQEEAKRIKFVSFELDIPNRLILDIEDIATLPKRWRSQPPRASTKNIGSDWVASMSSVALSVPSIIIPNERNYLLNPSHPDFSRVTIQSPKPFSFDARLWK
jgi:RES domain-containing protein